MRSNYYAKVTDTNPVLKMMDEHAEAGLPFLAKEYDDNYEEETQEGTSIMPSYHYIEAANIDGSNVTTPRHTVTCCQSQWTS